MTMIIHEGNCNGYGKQFAEYCRERGYNTDYRYNVSGIGDGLFDNDGNPVDNNLWDDFCNSKVE